MTILKFFLKEILFFAFMYILYWAFSKRTFTREVTDGETSEVKTEDYVSTNFKEKILYPSRIAARKPILKIQATIIRLLRVMEQALLGCSVVGSICCVKVPTKHKNSHRVFTAATGIGSVCLSIVQSVLKTRWGLV